MKKLKTIKEDQQQKTQAAATAQPSLKTAQRNKMQKDKLTDKGTDSALPKNNNVVFASKPEPNRGAGEDRRPNSPRAHRTGPTMENAVMSIGSGAVAGIQDPTTNYAFQVQKKKFDKFAEPKIARRKKIKEEFANGIGNTQLKPDTKKEPKSLATIKAKGIKSKTKAATPPSTTSNNIDIAPPTGGVAT